MAERWTRAFGRYLRLLRERRGLSLQDVASLSQPFADRVNKGYLSRCENGLVRLALSKVPTLSHIYKIPVDALLERIELDTELEKVGAPETEAMSLLELREAGRRAFNRGHRWKAYGFLRDAVSRSLAGPVASQYRDRSEQVAGASVASATAIIGLGKLRLALHECLEVEEAGQLGPAFRPLLLERLSVTYRNVGDLVRAKTYADRAISAAEIPAGRDYHGYALSARALVAHFERDLELAARLFREAHGVFKDSQLLPESARALNNLAQVYYDQGRYRSARLALAASESTLKPSMGHERHRALGRILLGEIEAAEQHGQAAVSSWKEAAAIARRLNDKTLQFKAEYHLLRQAFEVGNTPVLRSIQRRLSRLANYVPENTPELTDFRALTSRLHRVS